MQISVCLLVTTPGFILQSICVSLPVKSDVVIRVSEVDEFVSEVDESVSEVDELHFTMIQIKYLVPP